MHGPSHDQAKATVLTLKTRVFNKDINFIIDSGAECSLIPIHSVPASLLTPCNIRIAGVGGKLIPNLGQCCVTISVPKLRRTYTVNFIIADCVPLLGADLPTA